MEVSIGLLSKYYIFYLLNSYTQIIQKHKESVKYQLHIFILILHPGNMQKKRIYMYIIA